jgi:serine/threonine-protein kinase
MTRTRDPAHDLLFGLLALQNGLIDQAQLVAAFHAWARDKSRPLADHLVALGHLEPAHRPLLEGLAAAHLARHGGDAEKSLAVIPTGRSTREGLAQIGDPDLGDTLGHVGATSTRPDGDGDPDRTTTYAVGTATSDGQRFRVLRPHARGGLGAVYVALDNELHREVALKQILDHHADDPTSRARFLLETEITGGLEHPGIVPVYGLGTYGDGRPFYAMRLIKGQSLKEAIDRFHGDAALKSDPGRRSLELRKLLRRFLDVCNAIDYAHSRGVLHRDLKPGNVIVGRYGETLVVDWGLAKATGKSDPGAGEQTLVPSSASGSAETLPGSALGTPAYMSPEQAAGDLDRLGTRSDVYGLGAMLYYLLTGRVPFEHAEAGAIMRAVQEGAFPPPRQLEPSIEPALEAVCLKAMSLRPEDRYGSAHELAEDVERWLADEPVQAYREPWATRARRWLRQHRTLVGAGTAAATATLICLVVILLLQAEANTRLKDANRRFAEANRDLQAANARERSAKELAQARFTLAREAVDAYYTGVSGDMILKRKELEALRTKLLRAALEFYRKLQASLEAGAGTDPGERGELGTAYRRVASISDTIGSKVDAVEAQQRALAIYQGLARARPDVLQHRRDLATCLNDLGIYRRETGHLDESLQAHREALAIREELVADQPANLRLQAELASSHDGIGHLQQMMNRRAEAMASYRRALVIRERLAAGRPEGAQLREELAKTLGAIGVLHRLDGKLSEAMVMYRRSLAIRERLAADRPDDPQSQEELAWTLYRIANLQDEDGQADEALRTHKQALAVRERLAADHPTLTRSQTNLAQSYNNIGILMRRQGRTDEALESYRQALVIKARLAADQPGVPQFQADLAKSIQNIGNLQSQIGKPTEALESYRRALAIKERLVAERPVVFEYQADLARGLNNLGGVQAENGQTAEAMGTFRRSLSIWETLAAARPTPPIRSELARCFSNIGTLQDETGQAAEALRSHRRALAIREQLAADRPDVPEYQSDTATSYNSVGILRRAAGELDEALRSHRRALAIRERLAARHPKTPGYRADLASSCNNIGNLLVDTDRQAASRCFRQALEIREKLAADYPGVPQHREDLAVILGNLASLQVEAGQPTEALRSERRALAILEALAAGQPTIRKYRRHLANTELLIACCLLMRDGRSTEAENHLGRTEQLLQALTDPDAELLANLACAHALLGRPAGRGGPVPTPAEQAECRMHANQAIDALRRAIAAGYKDAAKLRRDPAVQPLRGRPDFQLLMMDVDFPADPFAR